MDRGRLVWMRHGAMASWILLVGFSYAPRVEAAAVERIVSLAPSLTETVYALGAGDKLVGVSVYCDYPPEVEKVERVGTFLAPNLERILAMKPDVVLALPTPGNRGSVETLQRLGLTVVVVDPNTLAETQDALVTVGRVLGREPRARALVASMRERIAAVRERVRDAPPRKVLMAVGHTPLIAAGAGTFQDEFIAMAGGVNVGAVSGGRWPHLSIEYALAAAPDVVIDTTMGNEEGTGEGAGLAFWKDFPSIPAVRAGRVYGYREYRLLRPGPRLDQAFEAIARFVQPERFAGAPARAAARP